MASVNLGKVIEKIVGRVKKEEEQHREETMPETAAEPTPEHAPVQTALQAKPVYIKSTILDSLEELENIMAELESGNIVIVRLTPLFDVDLDDVRRAVRKLKKVAQKIDGDIASLGEDRIVVTPSNIKVWRDKS
ncbi:cell division protein SepF [Candidatus Bathyarchaeota archaeon]|nr:cell division protein SepF [Candidatus Bathyarchaeota archaeon]